MSTYVIKDLGTEIKESYEPLRQHRSYYNMTKLEIFVFTSFILSTLSFVGMDMYSRIETDGQQLINFTRINLLEKLLSWSMHQNKDTDINISIDYKRQSNNSTEKFVVCYYTIPENWSTKWDLSPIQIDPYICTHIIVGFASITNCSVDMGVDEWAYAEVVNIKNDNPSLKVMISIGGGGDEANSGFSDMIKNHANRKQFIRSVLNVTEKLNFDGLDLDWEFPTWSTGKEKEKIHFAQLIQEIRKEFDRSRRKLILSVAVGAPQAIIDQCYIVPNMAEHVDFINLMSYDYHFFEKYFPVTDLNAPLFPNNMELGYLSKLNVNFSAHYWVTKKMPRDKIVVGIPMYGHSYKLDNPLNHKLLAPAIGFGQLGSKGFVSYSTICQFLDSGAISVFENTSKVPYAYKDYEWISYDDNHSIYYKTKWILDNNFKGAMVFSLNVDDWKNECNANETFSLTRAITKMLRGK
ncbi:PREDICTED: chitinase-3-like protein 2 isoform X1 [Polistes canadensis]|uniref:chitinase-3-like protein 2 isoform X1 n=2 Tax=Polistes canadensis TaxID=91411 RepID=UPI000718E8C6|nr:PREDICTED: chitinase-3-like protein 2 isoform X1 [Polistes canadensis]